MAGRGHQFPLDLAIEQRIRRLLDHRPVQAVLLGNPQRLQHLPGGEAAAADVPDLARADQIVQRPQAFVDRHLGAGPMQVVHVEVTDAQATQRRVALVDDVPARAAGRVRVVVGHRGVHLAGQHQPLTQPGPASQQLTEQFLAGTPAVHVGGVDAVDSRVNGEVEHGGSLVGAGGTAEEHRAEAERAD
jgi:hypothetical protein